MSLLNLKTHYQNGQTSTRNIASPSRNCLQAAARVLKKLESSTQAGPGQNVMTPIVSAAVQFTQAFLSDEDVAWLEGQQPGATLSVQGPLSAMSLPFELMRIRDSWLCCEFGVGRHVSDIKPSKAHSNAANETICVAAPQRELLWVTAEEATVTNALHSLAKTSDFCPPHEFPIQLSPEDVGEALELCRWFHFAGHGCEFDGQRALQLSQDSLITTEHLAALSRLPEVMFLNACGSLKIAAEDPAASLAGHCLRQGTQWLLGTVVPFTDDGIWEYVKAFYNALTKGESIGESTRQAHQKCNRLMPNSPAHLAQVLYGDPTKAFVDQPSSTQSSQTMTAVDVESQPAVAARRPRRESDRQRPEFVFHQRAETTKSDGPRFDSQRAWNQLLEGFEEAATRFQQITDPASRSVKSVKFERCPEKRRPQDEWEAMDSANPVLPTIAEFRATLRREKAIERLTLQFELIPEISLLSGKCTNEQNADLCGVQGIKFLFCPFELSDSVVASFQKAEVSPHRSLVLHDGTTGKSYFQNNDVDIIPWAKLFELETDQQQTVRVLNWIRAQLPTPVSIGSQDVSRKLSARQEPVEYAFRLAAESENVNLQKSEDFGLILNHQQQFPSYPAQ